MTAHKKPNHNALLLVVSGPAGSGKTTLCDRLLAEIPEVQRVVTTTTREPRANEKDGVDYYFFTPRQFSAEVKDGKFYEHATVHGRHYGILKREIHQKLETDTDILLNIDVQGAATIRKAAREDALLEGRVVTIFVAPSSYTELRARLAHRGDDDPEEIERRLKTAHSEMPLWREYDYFIDSRTREEDYDRLHAIYTAEKLRSTRHREHLNPPSVED